MTIFRSTAAGLRSVPTVVAPRRSADEEPIVRKESAPQAGAGAGEGYHVHLLVVGETESSESESA